MNATDIKCRQNYTTNRAAAFGGLCAEKTAPRCEKHGIPNYCGRCGPVGEPARG